MAWTRTYTARWEAWDTGAGVAWARGSHDGYTRQGASVVHRRTAWLREDGYVVLFDEITGGGPRHQLEAVFQFAPGVLALAAPSSACSACRSRSSTAASGLGLTALLAVMEGLGYGTGIWRDQGLLFSLNAHLWTNSIPILEVRHRRAAAAVPAGLCDGSLIGANGASEPDAGSDIFSMRTRPSATATLRAQRHEDVRHQRARRRPHRRLRHIDPALGAMGVTAFIIERDTPGVTISRELDKMGLRTSPMAEVVFEDCRVPVVEPPRARGPRRRGVRVLDGMGARLHPRELPGRDAPAARGCIRTPASRKQFGRPIGKFQAVANRIVDMKVRLDTCRPLVYRIGWLKDAGRPFAMLEAAIAKLYVSECFVKSSLDAVQIFGGYGYMTEQEIERDLRDAVGSTSTPARPRSSATSSLTAWGCRSSHRPCCPALDRPLVDVRPSGRRDPIASARAAKPSLPAS
jgi:alkylation response protein AidB-like acyl-CoA dehydrogenase